MSRLMLPHLHKFKLNILAKELQVGPFEHHRASEEHREQHDPRNVI